jgi:hypothetical protein
MNRLEREAKIKADMDAHVQKIIAKAPPLTAEQVVRIRDIFAGRDVAIPKKKVVDTAQAASILKCGVRQVTRMRNRGQLQAKKVDGRWFYDHDSVVWVRKNLERAVRFPDALQDAEMNTLIDLLIQDRLQKEWNPR